VRVFEVSERARESFLSSGLVVERGESKVFGGSSSREIWS